MIGPILGAPERLFHPGPWITLVALWSTFTTAPQLGSQETLTDRGDRFSAGAILVALLASILASVAEYAYGGALEPSSMLSAVLIGTTVIIGGLVLRIWAIRTLGRFFTATVHVVSDQRVIDDGPYRVLRHPSYTGAILTVLGVAIVLKSMTGALVTLGVCVPVYMYRIVIEETALSARLGDSYRQYQARTWRLVPFAY